MARNNYGVLLPIEFTIPSDFTSGNSIVSLLSEETKKILLDLILKVNKIEDSTAILPFSKIPFFHIRDLLNACEFIAYGGISTNDAGINFINIQVVFNAIMYSINVELDDITLVIEQFQLV